ncbi:MAG TPA: ATP-NAD kinase, partial [Pseudomonadales bacterium]
MAAPQLRIGLIVNPVAGLGGPAALKGSDGVDTQRRALSLGSQPRA